AELIAKLMNKEIEIASDPNRMRPKRSEIQRVEADSSKAKELLGWEPTVNLEDGLKRTIDWILSGGYEDVPVRH
ncbi:MAG: GDP-mannose 4,6-dehydratase, partial [Candidatus Hydrogenedentes bacterium]|nr:GDP-mannose 4,6-dehydratase [Candidatus Hydrogenedentota bacterium]